MLEQVFINCVLEDTPIAEEIEKRLDLVGISFYVAPTSSSPAVEKELVEKIQAIAAGNGCMVCILSQKAIVNSLFISNIQLMCETARNARVLVNYPLERLENDQNILLFASQAFQVNKSGRIAEDLSRIIHRINQIVHPPAKDILQLFSGIISRRALIRLLLAVAALGVIASVFFNNSQKATPVPVQPTSTPALIFTPFSGQSQNRGLTQDARYVPDYKPDGDPAVAAPFYFKPGAVFEQEDFNDPAFNNSYDQQKWSFSSILNDVSSMAVTQTNGILQLAMAPLVNQNISLVLRMKYLYNRQQVIYLGYRFRLNDYQGKILGNTSLHGHFFDQYTGPESYIDTIQLDGLSQDLIGEASGIALGSRWHTVEMVSQEDRHFVDVFLDGKKIKALSFSDEQLNRWTNYTFAMDITNTTDWVRIQIDKIVFGGDQPLPVALQPEQAPYRFTPDSVDVHEGFSTQGNQQAFGSGAEFVTQSNGVLSFRIPAGKENQVIGFDLPGKPVNEDNYYATRFRFTSPDDNTWADFSYFFLGTHKINPPLGDAGELSIGTFRGYDFQGHFGSYQAIDIPGFNLNTQAGRWHTLEMLIKPPDGTSQQYTAIYWVDGYLLGKVPIQDPTPFLDTKNPPAPYIQISGGSYRQNIFSGEIDDLVIGTIASDKIKE